jgi:exodeoxyribonuclease-1
VSSIYWYDYETFGADPRRDRPAQFAGIRTDLDLNPVGDPLNLYCRPADDFLPSPDACLITGITPQKALADGLPETEFIQRILEEFSQPETCVSGYNSIRFDDEVTRFTLYRNLFEPYGREWQNGNSRWDIIDMVRLTHALRPDGIEWPKHADGKPSFRLEELTQANGITHQSAHDALSDVYATIAMAGLIRQKQPRLYDFVFQHRSKHKVAGLLNTHTMAPVLHVSAMYPAELGCIAMVAPIAMHPSNKNEVIVYDLRHDPEPFLNLSPHTLRERLFTAKNSLPEGMERLPIKTIHINKCPVVVPANTLTGEAGERWQIFPQQCEENHSKIRQTTKFVQTVVEVFSQRHFEPVHDPDLMLYGGNFFSNADRIRMQQVHDCPIAELAHLELPFDDERLPEMLFRYRARNYPENLSHEERTLWQEFRHRRLVDPEAGASIVDNEFVQRIK